MATTVEDQLAALRKQITAAQNKKARAAVDLENASDRLDQARLALKQEYGVETTAEARAALEKLRSDLTASMDEIQELLTAAGT